MKKKYFYLALGLMSAMPIITSCGSDDEVKASDVIQNDEKPVNDVWDVIDQQSYMDKVGRQVLNELNSADFEEDVQNLQEASFVIQKADYSEVPEGSLNAWRAQAMGSMIEELETLKEYIDETPTYTIYSLTYQYKALFNLRGFTGHFDFDPETGKCTFTECADDTQITYTNSKGEKCVILLTSSPKTTTMHVIDAKSSDSDSWNEECTEQYENNAVEYISVEVPESITLTMTVDGKQMIKLDMNVGLSGLDINNDYNVSKSSLALSMNLTLDNGWQVGARNFNLNKNTFAAQGYVSHNGKELMRLTIGSNLQDLPDMILPELMGIKPSDIMAMIGSGMNATGINVCLDIAGKVQARGYVQNAVEFYMLGSTMEGATSEALFNQSLEKLNNMIDAYITFNGGTTRQANLLFRSHYNEPSESWVVDPAIQFNDKSESSFGDYFHPSNFAMTLKALSDIQDEFGKYFKAP